MKKICLAYCLIILLLAVTGCGQTAAPLQAALIDPVEAPASDPVLQPTVPEKTPGAYKADPVPQPELPKEPVTVPEVAETAPEAGAPAPEAEAPAPQPSEADGLLQEKPPAEPPKAEPAPAPEEVYTQEVQVTASAPAQEAEVLQQAPAAVAVAVKAQAPGTQEKRCDKAVVDYSNTQDGYVMVQYTAQTDKKLKCRVTGPATTYTYNLKAGEWATFSLSDGDGGYTVSVFENVVDAKYATVLTASFEVKAKDEFAPFLLPNQYVDYENAPNTVAKAAELTAGVEDALKKVETVYDFVVGNLTYDKQLAQTVQSGYLPVLDTVLEKKTGICFDYAALMAGMLRSQDVPCKLVVGYAGQAYHAWINVWTEETGWVDGIIFFDGHAWKRMDPTFASSANASAEIMAYIGDGTNYTAKYVY